MSHDSNKPEDQVRAANDEVVNTAARPRKKYLMLVQEGLNQAIADGFRPYDPHNPEALGSAANETARRLGIPLENILKNLEGGEITQNPALYKPRDPHATFIAAMRAAGVEIAANDNGARMNVRRLTDEALRLRRTLKMIDRDNLTTTEIREKIYRLSALPPEVPAWAAIEKTTAGSPGVPLTLWSDWHYGETVRSEEMSGMNEYNLKIADRRIKTLVERIIDITMRHQVNPNYPGIVVCLGGDMFSGDNLHPELTDTNEEKTIALFPRLQGRLIWAIEKLADEFGQVYVPCAFGNHGRNEQKPRFKLRAETSYEYLLYNQLEFYFKNHPKYRDQVVFNIPVESGTHFAVGGHRYYLTHGDALGVKGGDGIIGAIGPIKRGAIKTGTSEASIGHDYDTILMGHWHQYIPMQGVIVNGALKGWDEYARLQLRAPYDAPSQALWFNHPEYGPVTHHKVILDKLAPTMGANNRAGPVFPSPKRDRDRSAKLAA